MPGKPPPRTTFYWSDLPVADQHAWEAAIAPSLSLFCDRPDLSSLSPKTVSAAAYSYLRAMTFISRNFPERMTLPASDRITTEIADAYLASMEARQLRRDSIVSYFGGLRQALSWMYPEKDFRWLSRPGGRSLKAHLPPNRMQRKTPHSLTILNLAERIFDEAVASECDRTRLTGVRDAVAVGLEGLLGLRRSTLSRLRLGIDVVPHADGWDLDVHRDILKTGRWLPSSQWVPVGPIISPWLSRYVEVERKELLEGRTDDRLLIAWRREGLTPNGISTRFRVLTNRFLGEQFCTLECRHGVATTISLEGSAHPLDASLLLGHKNPKTTLEHYNRASAVAAGKRHAERLRQMRGTRFDPEI